MKERMFCDYTQSDLDKVIALLLASEELRFSGLMNRDLPNQGGIYRIYNFLEENKYSLDVPINFFRKPGSLII